jgi:hypothetical protein
VPDTLNLRSVILIRFVRIHFRNIIALALVFCCCSNTRAASTRTILLASRDQPFRVSEQYFTLAAQFYGAGVDTKDIQISAPDANFFRDDNGSSYPCAAISENVLEGLDTLRQSALKKYVEGGGVLLIFDVSNSTSQGSHSALQRVTNGRVQGAEYRSQPSRSSIFTSSQPQLTDVFTGVTLNTQSRPNNTYDQALQILADTTIVPIVNSIDSLGNPFTIFISYRLGAGTIYASSANQRHTISRLSQYYSEGYAPEVLPGMMVLKMIYGSTAWHSSGRFANLTIDDPPLADRSGYLDYADLLSHTQAHSYHLTIAYVPQNFITRRNTPDIEQLFMANPRYFSFVQHGDFHRPEYEFYAYTKQDSARLCDSLKNYCRYTPVPFSKQELLIVDGLTKYSLLESKLGIPSERNMVFPSGICPAPTLQLMNKYDYNGVINGLPYPLLSSPDSTTFGQMFPAITEYYSFPIYPRKLIMTPIDSISLQALFSIGVFNLFAGKPALYYSHIKELFPPSSGFDLLADALNRLAVPPEWKSQNFINSHLYLTKTNSDGSDSVLMYGNKTVFEGTAQSKTIHLIKQVTNYPLVRSVAVNGVPVAFQVNNGILSVDFPLGANAESTMEIFHDQGSLDYVISKNDVRLAIDGMTVLIHNEGDSPGICSVAMIDSNSMRVLDVQSVSIDPRDSASIRFSVYPASFTNTWLVLNPLKIGPELNTSNNKLKLDYIPSSGDNVLIDNFEYPDLLTDHGWSILTPTVDGSMNIVYDSSRNSKVLDIQTSSGTNFEVGKRGMTLLPHIFSLNMKTGSNFYLYLQCLDSTSKIFFLQYEFSAGETQITPPYVIYHVGTTFLDNQWHLFERNIKNDLISAGWQSKITQIMGLFFRGSVQIDDIKINDSLEGVTRPSLIIGGYNLKVNYPNPFNPETRIEYHLPSRSRVQLNIFDLLSREIRVIVNQIQEVGDHTVTWDGRNDLGVAVASGVYFYELQANSLDNPVEMFIQTKKMLLIR